MSDLKVPQDEEEEECECGGSFSFEKYCGSHVCSECRNHKGMVRCFCGWSKTRPGDGYNELIEMGETIEPEE